MCGIAGILSLTDKPIRLYAIKKMCDVMCHRGPDDAGYVFFQIGRSGKEKGVWREYFDKDFSSGHPDYFSEMPYVLDTERREGEPWYLVFGHRRLSILDLTSAGHQPMSDAERRIWITYNGEVYNFKELRKELEGLGHVFRSNSDTEVVINSYKAWGIDCILRFNGMFAFALWDGESNQLFLARDRYGIKPFYYYFNGGLLIFASEIKAIIENEEVIKEVDYEALNEYFTFQNILSDKTLFKNIHILPAGHIFCFRQNSDFHAEGLEQKKTTSFNEWRVSLWKYWDFDFSNMYTPQELPEESCIQELRHLFFQAVERHLVSDVPVGAYLSGGMDSGSIVATANKKIPRLMSFTGGFDLSSVSGLELTFDEREPAEFMSSCFGTEHYEMVMHSGDMAWVMPQMIWHLEDLRVGMCWQNYYIARLASKFVKVVLSGTGGDENFAGYPWRYFPMIYSDEDRVKRIKTYYSQWQRLIPDEKKSDFFAPQLLNKTDGDHSYQVFNSILEEMPGRESIDLGLSVCLYFELKTFLHGLFVVEDKISMAHSIEVRVPFLDNDLVSFALRIPNQYKLPSVNGVMPVEENMVGAKTKFFAQSNSGKYIFRQTMRGIVPDEILDRKKQGFSPPDQSWYRGPTMGYIREILLNEKTLSRGFFKPESMQQIVSEHTEGKVNHRLLIWSLLSFEWWNRIFMDE
jgi:asparagine synthase (glutamine-hydrolysing)